jgi:xanthine dehydrogenase accessory factor
MPENKNSQAATAIAQTIQQALEEGATGVLVTLIYAPDNVGAKLFISEDRSIVGSLGDTRLDSRVAEEVAHFLDMRDDVRSFKVEDFASELSEWIGAQLLFERIQPEPRIVICGAGHVGASLARLATFVGYRVILIDDRAEFLTREQFPAELIDLVATTSWALAVRDAIGNGRGVSVAVVTRGHNEDEECMQAAVPTQASYIGLIGSKRRTNIVLNRLRQSGGNDDQISKVHAPIGLDIGAVTPEEVALAILAEIVSIRRGGKGGSLSTNRSVNNNLAHTPRNQN